MTQALLWSGMLIGAGGCSFVLTGATRSILLRYQILAYPSQRSSHRYPTPLGGGWAVVLTVLLGWSLTVWGYSGHVNPELGEPWLGEYGWLWGLILAATCGLMALSWVDDLHAVGAGYRLLAQVVAVGLVFVLLPQQSLVFHGLFPYEVDRIAAAIAWLWFTNLYNFVDGIDGLAGSQLVVMALGLFWLGLYLGAPLQHSYMTAILAGAGIGFLFWNWQPAKIFLGDVGSIPLGYLIGWLLLDAAVRGAWLATIILPLYLWTDTTVTLVRRLLQGKPIWQAHLEHFFHQAVQRGYRHAQVVRVILLAECGLLVLALASVNQGWWVMIPALTIVLVLLWYLVWSKPAGRSSAKRRSADCKAIGLP